MASTKQLFSKGIGYDKYQIADTLDLIQETEETLSYFWAMSSEEQKVKARYIQARQLELKGLKNDLRRLKNQLKEDIKQFGYTQQEVDAIPIPTEEELAQDLARDEKEVDNNYNTQDLINLIRQYEKEHAEELV